MGEMFVPLEVGAHLDNSSSVSPTATLSKDTASPNLVKPMTYSVSIWGTIEMERICYMMSSPFLHGFIRIGFELVRKEIWQSLKMYLLGGICELDKCFNIYCKL